MFDFAGQDFDVILADPPWSFSGNSVARPGRNVRRHYATMTVAEVAAMPVREIAAPRALLLLWITVPHEHRANEVIEAWGFRAKSRLVWDKRRIWTGYWARNQHEPLIVATRGRFPCPRPALFPTSIIPGERREHSRKPEWVQDVVDSRLPDALHPERWTVSQHREDGRDRQNSRREEAHGVFGTCGEVRGMADCDGAGRLSGPQPGIHCGQEGTGSRHGEPERSGHAGGMVHGLGAGLERHRGHGDGSHEPGRLDPHTTGSLAAAGADGGMADLAGGGRREERQDGRGGAVGDPEEGIAAGLGPSSGHNWPGPLHGFWADADWLFCRDGKWRPVEPGLKPLAHGVSGRVGLLRGYGNAINPHAAAEFIQAFNAVIEGREWMVEPTAITPPFPQQMSLFS